MMAWAVVEITPTTGRRPPAKLIRCAYRASQARHVALVLNDVDPHDVNHILDPVVPLMDLTIPGVSYVGIQDEKRVQTEVESAQIIFAATENFRDMLLNIGVNQDLIRPVSSALTMLNGGEDRRRYSPVAKPARQNDRQVARSRFRDPVEPWTLAK